MAAEQANGGEKPAVLIIGGLGNEAPTRQRDATAVLTVRIRLHWTPPDQVHLRQQARIANTHRRQASPRARMARPRVQGSMLERALHPGRCRARECVPNAWLQRAIGR